MMPNLISWWLSYKQIQRQSLHTHWAREITLQGAFLVLPQGSFLISQILRECHDIKTRGHFGFLKTNKRVVTNVYWVGKKHDIHLYVATCEGC